MRFLYPGGLISSQEMSFGEPILDECILDLSALLHPIKEMHFTYEEAHKEMEFELSKDHEMLENFTSDFDMLLPDDNFETKSILDSSFLDSLINDGNLTQWPEVFPQLSDLRNYDDDVEIKTEVSTPDDSLQSVIYSDSSSNSSDEKFTFETPPVSPPREELSHRLQFSLSEPPQKKSTILKINPNNIKIIRNVKGFKPVGKQTQIVLPKDVLQKVMKCKSEDEKPRKTSVSSIHPQITVAPIILPSNQLSRIPLCTSETANVKLESLSQPIAPTPFIKRDSIEPSMKNDINIKALKRQQRMIKNRESACLSRKKKKEYVTKLENRVSDLENENSHLKCENERLKGKIKELESNFSDFLKPNKFLNTSLRKTTALLAVLLMVSLNIGSMSLLSREHLTSELTGKSLLPADTGSKHGRALLWAQPELQETAENNTTPDRSTCPLHINQTESLRLEKELRRWIEIGENKFKNNTKTSRGVKPRAKLPPSVYPPYRLKTLKKSYRWRGGISALELYRPPFPGSLPRRDDTFYVFSFSSDHLLVPALAHDKTLRPKMSFLIPTVPLNDSALVNGSVPMMQVDCEVLATKSVELTEEDFRTFRPKQETSGKNSSSSNEDLKNMNYRPYFIGAAKPDSQIDHNFDSYLKHVYRTGNSLP